MNLIAEVYGLENFADKEILKVSRIVLNRGEGNHTVYNIILLFEFENENLILVFKGDIRFNELKLPDFGNLVNLYLNGDNVCIEGSHKEFYEIPFPLLGYLEDIITCTKNGFKSFGTFCKFPAIKLIKNEFTYLDVQNANFITYMGENLDKQFFIDCEGLEVDKQSFTLRTINNTTFTFKTKKHSDFKIVEIDLKNPEKFNRPKLLQASVVCYKNEENKRIEKICLSLTSNLEDEIKITFAGTKSPKIYCWFTKFEFENLVGETFVKVVGLEEGSTCITFLTVKNVSITLSNGNDDFVDNIKGDPDDLLESLIVKVHEYSDGVYVLETERGVVSFEWFERPAYYENTCVRFEAKVLK